MKPEIETLERIAEKYRIRISGLNGSLGRSHFNHLIGSLYTIICAAPVLSSDEQGWEDFKGVYRKSVKTLKTYLNLMEKFPEFREAELRPEGYFPEIQSVFDDSLKAQGWMSASHYYVHEANKRLRGRQ